MNTLEHYIECYDQVINAFGYWPRFHDSEIRALGLDRNSMVTERIPEVRLELCIHAFEWTAATPPVFNHHLVQLLFCDVDDVSLAGFNHQNAIIELDFEVMNESQQGHSGIQVTIVGAYGLSGSFTAGGCKVISVIPCDANGHPVSRPNPFPIS